MISRAWDSARMLAFEATLELQSKEAQGTKRSLGSNICE